MRATFFCLALVLLLTGCASETRPAVDEATLQEGVNLLGQGRYAEALTVFRPGAEAGDFASQGFMAHTYFLMENLVEAYAWYHAAAECGSLDAKMDRAVLQRKLSPKTLAAASKRGESLYAAYCPR